LALMLALLAPTHAFATSHVLIVLNQDSQPKYFLNDPKQRGLCGDIYAELKSRLANKGITLSIQSTYTPIKRIMQKLKTGSAQAYCGAGRNAEREKKYYFSNVPLYSVSNVLIARSYKKTGPTSFEEMESSQSKMGTYFGTSTDRFLKNRGNINIVKSFYTLNKAFTALDQKKIDYFYYHDLALNYYLRNSTQKLRVLPTKFRTYNHWMIYSKSMHKHARDLMDKELTDMVQSGLIEQFHRKYRVK
ncbi:MAG: transporter substrate-binding domain-containing protein, partial [Rhodospirillales bacterium]|nr:transporter substrate-binding domain-containing protein [Rhodospirillales bacterium]